jgi:hypothetical protein
MGVPVRRLHAVPSHFLALAACGTNPVTGKMVVRFVSKSAELPMKHQGILQRQN